MCANGQFGLSRSVLSPCLELHLYVSSVVFCLTFFFLFVSNKNGMSHCYIEHFKAWWFLYVPPGLTFTNSAFCPHTVFMCFVSISEQTAIISLYRLP